MFEIRKGTIQPIIIQSDVRLNLLHLVAQLIEIVSTKTQYLHRLCTNRIPISSLVLHKHALIHQWYAELQSDLL